MRLTCFLLFCMLVDASATTFAQKINLSVNNAPLEKVLKEIRKQSKFDFVYDGDLVSQAKPVSLTVKNEPIESVLEKCFKTQPITYFINKKTIVLKQRASSEESVADKAPITIRGTVVDQDGAPLAGVTVKIAGRSGITITDGNGRYSIVVPSSSSELSFTYVGYEAQQIAVGDKRVIDVALKQKASDLNKVVVIGYGTQKVRDLTGSVGTVSMSDLGKAPVRSFDEALAGRVAGVAVSSQDGQPGSPVNIVIRGNNSLTQSNSPLYVIDGFPIEGYNNNLLSPNEIESIDVLKDASSTAIYGARGANGIIIITTKKGKVGAPVISYDSYYGLQKRTKTIPLLSTYEFAGLQNEVLGSSVFSDIYLTPQNRTLDDYKNIEAINWQNLLERTAPMYNHFLSVNGGSSDTRYSVSGSINKQNGIVIGSGYSRYQGRAVLDQNINKKLKVGINASYSTVMQSGTPPSAAYNAAPFNLMYQIWGFRPVTGDNGDIVNQLYDPTLDPTANYIVNPLSTAQNELRNQTTTNIIANSYVEYQLIPNLKLRVTGGINNTTLRSDVFNNSKTNSGGPRSVFGAGVNGSVTYAENYNWLNENMLTYSKKFGKNHDFNFLLGVTQQGNRTKSYGLAANRLPNENLGLSGLDEGTPQPVIANSSSWALGSFLGRINYTLKSKYLFTFSYRSDGSSKFSPENRWSYFPSGAFAWRLSDEGFMKKIKVISNAKLRMSYGVTGNNRVSDFGYLSTLTSGTDAIYPFNNNPGGNLGAYPSTIGNPDLKWETTYAFDGGFDLGLFRDRISLVVDIYRKTTKNLLLNAQLPTSTGFTTAFKNIGKVQNQGLEVSLNTININAKNFNWSTNFNIAFNFSKVLQLAQNQDALPVSVLWDQNYNGLTPYLTKIGQPVSAIYGLIADGIYQYSDFNILYGGRYLLKDNIPGNGAPRANILPGDIRYRDVNGDNTIDTRDYTIIGRALPVHAGGFSNNFGYKDFDLNVFLQWSYGNDVINANRYVFESGYRPHLNQFATYANRWSPSNTETNIPRYSTPSNYQYSSRVVEDGSYLRLKTVSLGYTFNAAGLKKYNIKSLRIALSGQNLATITGYSGLDPEVSVRNTTLTQGFDFSPYPRAKTYSLNLNLKF